jgi:transcriptional regulator with XRE-family HTH domain
VKKLPRAKRKNAGYYLRIWRAERDLTQSEAAKYFDIKPSHWSLLEDGRRFASPAVAKQLAEATGAPLETFLNMGDEANV